MQRTLALLFLVIVLAAAALAGEKSSLPRQIVYARYVYVTDLAGRSDLSPSMHNPDRHAVFDVQDALKQWKHYIVVYQPEQADIIIGVRSGRLVGVQGTGSIPVGGAQIGYPRRGDTQNSPFPGGQPGVGVAVDTGPSDDLLEVRDARQWPDGGLLYRRLRAGGLNPGLPLFKDFRNEVEKAAKEDQEKEKKDAKKKKSP